MAQASSNIREIRFDEPRLRMTIAGRSIVRIATYVFYLVLAGAAVSFLLSDVRPVFALGLFIVLMLIDLFVHRGEGDSPISKLPKTGGRVNLAATLSTKAYSVLERSLDRSAIAKSDFYLEVANRLLEFPQVEDGLRRLDVKPDEFRERLAALLAEPVNPPDTGSREARLQKVALLAAHAFEQAIDSGHNFVLLADLFSALGKVDDEGINRLFNLFSIDVGDLERALIFSSATGPRFFGRTPVALGGFVMDSHRQIRHRIMNRAWTSRPTPLLDRYGIDYTDLARNGQLGFMIGHETEFERLVETLGRPINPNALLVGEAGVGKETMIHHLAFQLVKDDVPRQLFDKRLVGLQLQNLVAGAPAEELNLRLKTIVEEIYVAGNVILYIPDIHNLVHTSGTAFLSAADALMPVIMNNAFPVVGSTYAKEFKQLIEPRSDFTGAFETIHVEEISEADAQKLLTYESLILERGSGITISFGAVKRAVSLAKKYFHTKRLPSSAEELLKTALVDAEHRGEKLLGPERVTAVCEAKINIPIHEAEGGEAEKLLKMEDIIHERLVDQEEAVKAVSQALREYRSGLVRKGGPIASFLFVGPTGVGKTELAKILAELQFGSQKLMVRFDMTEYQDKQSFFRFIGSPDGTVRGALTDAVLEKPYSLILLDEFEKAYPDILNLFLQVLDDGRLTDNLARTVDFSNTIIIATSNAHSDIINDALSKGESMSDISEYLKTRLVDVFKPELLNRFSKIIIFKNLRPQDLGRIVEVNLQEIVDIMKEQGIFLSFDQDAISRLAKLGYDPQFGARPLRRVIDDKIRAPLSEAILSKKVIKGNKVKIVVKGDDFDFVPDTVMAPPTASIPQ